MTFKISSESLISRFGSSSFSWQGDVKNTNPLEFFSWSESPIGLLSTHTWHWRFSEVPCRVDVFRLGRTCVSAELRRLSITFHCLHDDSFLNANTFKNVSSFPSLGCVSLTICRMMWKACSRIQLLQEESFSVLTLSLDCEPTSVVYDSKTSSKSQSRSNMQLNLSVKWETAAKPSNRTIFEQSKILNFTIGEKKYI